LLLIVLTGGEITAQFDPFFVPPRSASN